MDDSDDDLSYNSCVVRQVCCTTPIPNSLAHWSRQAGDPAAACDQLAGLLADRLRAIGPDHPQHPHHPEQKLATKLRSFGCCSHSGNRIRPHS